MDIRKLFDLQVGDRFYFKEDLNRKVWEIDYIDRNKEITFTGENERCRVHYKDDLNHFEVGKKNKAVVFVRSVFTYYDPC